MQKVILYIMILTILFPLTATANTEEKVKAAFIRYGNIWMLVNGQEKQITSSGRIFSKPKWSADGEWLAYQIKGPSEHQEGEQQVEIWAYHIKTGEKKKIFYDGYSPTWAPNKNVLAFNDQGILNISDLEKFYNIATGVNSYTWLPDGSGFLLSASGVLKPDGWSGATLFTKVVKDYQHVKLFGGVNPFFNLPKEIGIKGNKIITPFADEFSYSPSNKWISFIVSPTASWSMDSNMLCVISSEGKKFEVLDEVILDVGEPKWAPSKDILAYIAGGGRIVFGFKNKDLKLREMPASGTSTPEHYADFDFDWVTDDYLITSRMKEKEWSNKLSEHPLPTLYSIDLNKNKQVQITHPPASYGDYNPKYVKSIDKIIWFRGTSIISSENRSLWKANKDGSKPVEWLKDVEAIEFYEGK